MQPDEQFSVAFEALQSDSKEWHAHADVMEQAARNAASYSLSGFDFGHVANALGVGRKYQEVQDLAVRLLSEGAEATREFAQTLVQVADDYQSTDVTSGARIRRITSTEGTGN